MTQLKNIFHMLIVLALWQSCGRAQEAGLSKEEREVLRSGINEVLQADMSDYVLISSFADFSNLYISEENTEIEKAFETANEEVVQVAFNESDFPSSLMPREAYDSLFNESTVSGFWRSFRSQWGEGKAGFLEITRPVISGNSAFFWFSHMEGPKSGAVVRVWLKKQGTGWKLERADERLEF